MLTCDENELLEKILTPLKDAPLDDQTVDIFKMLIKEAIAKDDLVALAILLKPS